MARERDNEERPFSYRDYRSYRPGYGTHQVRNIDWNINDNRELSKRKAIIYSTIMAACYLIMALLFAHIVNDGERDSPYKPNLVKSEPFPKGLNIEICILIGGLLAVAILVIAFMLWRKAKKQHNLEANFQYENIPNNYRAKITQGQFNLILMVSIFIFVFTVPIAILLHNDAQAGYMFRDIKEGLFSPIIWLITGGIYVIILTELAFKWWRAAVEQKNLEMEHAREILNTPLEELRDKTLRDDDGR